MYVYVVLAVKPVAVKELSVCQPLPTTLGSPTEVTLNRYSTGPLTSEPIVAVIVIDVLPIAVGTETNDAGFGVGGSVSPVGVAVIVVTPPT